MRSVMKRMMVIVMIVAVLTAQMPGEAAAAAKPIMMSLNYSTVLVKVHGKQTLGVSSIAPNGASKAVKYEIANRKVATVSKKGVVKGKKVGITTIRVTSKKNKKLKKLVKVIVADKVPTKVKMSSSSLKMKVAQTKTLKATVTPAKVLNVYKKGSWVSTDTETVSVSSKGVLTAHQEGTVSIIFTTLNGKRAVCQVTVTADQAAAVTEAPAAVNTPIPAIPAQPSSGAAVTSAGAVTR
ncbi:Ig-like domain-containing protein [Jutongia sp.]